MKIDKTGFLIVMGRLPGTGKTSISKELSLHLGSVYLRIDTIEQTLLREAALKVGNEGYIVAYAIAEDNLKLGNIVIADSVNPISLTREAWHGVAKKSSANILEIEVICSNEIIHQRRVRERTPDILGHNLPIWDDVINRKYDTWETKHLTIDTSKQTIAEAAGNILKYIAKTYQDPRL